MESKKSSKAQWIAIAILVGVIVGVILVVATSSDVKVRTIIVVVLCLISFIAGKLSNRNKKDNEPG